MATTITNAALTVSITENVKLNGVQQGGTNLAGHIGNAQAG